MSRLDLRLRFKLIFTFSLGSTLKHSLPSVEANLWVLAEEKQTLVQRFGQAGRAGAQAYPLCHLFVAPRREGHCLILALTCLSAEKGGGGHVLLPQPALMCFS